MRFAAGTDLGLVRKNNEDAIFARDGAVGPLDNLFMVADGMGGHLGGEYASSFLVSEIPQILEKRRRHESVHSALSYATAQVNRSLHRLAEQKEDLRGMGSTLVMASVKNGEAHIINVGDSRLYLYDGSLTQITKDHSMVEELVEIGRLTRDDPFYAANKNVITRAMGIDADVEESYYKVSLAKGSRLLLCSDGLSGPVSDGELEAILAEGQPPEETVERLIACSREKGGPDNISAIVIDTDEE